jgi:putative aminopeptidase FrvX
MHTTVEMVHQEDVENTIKLMFETVCAIKKGMKVKYL